MTRVLEWYDTPAMGEPQDSRIKLIAGISLLRRIRDHASDYGVDHHDVAALVMLVSDIAQLQTVSDIAVSVAAAGPGTRTR